MPETQQQSCSVTLSDGSTLDITWAGATDRGRRRDSNQDAFLAEYPLFVVADGMGGHAGGEIASRSAIEHLRTVVGEGRVTAAAIEEALLLAKDDIASHLGSTDEGTGTTLTGIFLVDTEGTTRWMSLNIGDSRVYLLRDDRLVQVTTDHSVVQELIDAGRLSPEEAEGHPYSNVITRAVGASESTVPDYVALEPADGDVFVICSDGLTKELTDFGIQHFLTLHRDPAAAVDAMMSAALENGGRDNVTIIVVHAAVHAGDAGSGVSDSRAEDDSPSTVEETAE